MKNIFHATKSKDPMTHLCSRFGEAEKAYLLVIEATELALAHFLRQSSVG